MAEIIKKLINAMEFDMTDLNGKNIHSAETRKRTFTWEDPMIGAGKAMTMNGLDYLKEIEAGIIPPPPIGLLMDFSICSIKPGEVIFDVTPSEFHYNPIGMVHGGLYATIMDSTMGSAIQTTLPAGSGYSTIDLQITYIKSARIETGTLTCVGKVIHSGRKIATGYAEVRDSKGVLYAHATTTCMILSTGK